MRISRIDIDGFGIFCKWPFLVEPGLTIFRGKNEAGKSTLLAFIRATLFGFDPNKYPAVNGGRRGGRIEVLLADARSFTIERHGDKGGPGKLVVRDGQGTEGGADVLARLLRGVQAKVYKNIFGFSLQELQDLETLTEGDLAARIYGAGAGTGSASALNLEHELLRERDELYKAGGQNPQLNQVLRRLEEIDIELSKLDVPALYASKHARLGNIEDALRTLHERDKQLEAQLAQKDRIVRGWQSWVELKTAESEWSALGDVVAIGPFVGEEEVRLAGAVTGAEQQLTAARARLKTMRDQMARYTRDDSVLERRAALDSLVQDRQADHSVRDVLERERSQQALLTEQCTSALARIGPGWTAQRIELFDDSIQTRGTVVGRFRPLLEGAQQQRLKTETDVRIADAEAAAAVSSRQ